AVPLSLRPHEVLPRHRQPALRALPRAAARGPHRHPDRQQAALQPRHGVGRALPPDRRTLAVRQGRPDRDREQPGGGGRSLSAHAGRAQPRGGAGEAGGDRCGVAGPDLRADQAPGRPRRHVVAIWVGVLLALAVGLMSTTVGLDRDRALYPAVTMVVASYYTL